MKKKSRLSRNAGSRKKKRLLSVWNPYESYEKNVETLKKPFKDISNYVLRKYPKITKRVSDKEIVLKLPSEDVKIEFGNVPETTPPYKDPVIWIGGSFDIRAFEDIRYALPLAKKYIDLLIKNGGFTQGFYDDWFRAKIDAYNKRVKDVAKAKVLGETKRFALIEVADDIILHMKDALATITGDSVKWGLDLSEYHKSYHKELRNLCKKFGVEVRG